MKPPEPGPDAAPPAPSGHRRDKTGKPRSELRVVRHARHARMIWNEPRSAATLIRDGLLGIWRARGGGFYGLGYLVTFVVLEMRTVVGEFEGSASVMAFIGQELVEYLLRLGFMSFLNAFLAFLWPFFVLERLGVWGLLVLAGGYLVFERGLRPAIESRFPDLGRPRDPAGP